MESTEVSNVSIESLRETSYILDVDDVWSDTREIVNCIRAGGRTPSEIGRTKEAVRELAEARGLKGRIKMWGVEVDVDQESNMTCEHWYTVTVKEDVEIEWCRYCRHKVHCGASKDYCECPEAWGKEEEDERRG